MKLGLLGAGTVGTALAGLLKAHDEIEILGALVRDTSKPREGISEDILTTDSHAVMDAGYLGGVDGWDDASGRLAARVPPHR